MSKKSGMDVEPAQLCITAGRKIKCQRTVFAFESFQWFLIGAVQGENQVDYSNDW
jgi:hypothetical protein